MSVSPARVTACALALICAPVLAGRTVPSDSPTLVGVWTPPVSSYDSGEISKMPSVLLLKAGTLLPLSVNLSTEDTWEAEYGATDAHGHYEAPPYVPAGGIDTVTLTDHTVIPYVMFTLRIRIVPNPAIPGSGETPYVISAPVDSVDANGGEQRLGEDSGIVFPKAFPLPPAKFLRRRAVLKPGQKLDPPVEFTRVRPSPLSRDRAYYILPATSHYGAVTDSVRVSIRAIKFIPHWAKELPHLAGDPDTDPDPRMDTRPDVEKAVNAWRTAHARKPMP